MRITPHGIGSVLHCMQRGVQDIKLVRDLDDQHRFRQSLFILNDEFQNQNWLRDIAKLPPLVRPDSWPKQRHLCRILAWTLMTNHFHLLLQETSEGGIAKFMQRLCGSMSLSFNKKYGSRGTIFQGSYRGVTVESGNQMRYVTFYILVKNVLELYPGGLMAAAKDFNRAWEWALQFPFSSLRISALNEVSPIINDEEKILAELSHNPHAFKREAKEAIKIHLAKRSEEFAEFMLED